MQRERRRFERIRRHQLRGLRNHQLQLQFQLKGRLRLFLQRVQGRLLHPRIHRRSIRRIRSLTDLDNLEADVDELNKLLDRWADDAPSEIRGDVRVIVDALHGFFEILEENDFDFIAIATSASNDPRFLALDSDQFQAATDRLSEYCGYDIDPPQAPGPDLSGRPGAPGGLPDGELPDDFPEALIPPNSEIEFAGLVGPGIGAQLTSTATFDEVIAFYEDVLGDATVTSDESTIWSIFEDGALTTVTVLGTDGDVEIGIVLVTP